MTAQMIHETLGDFVFGENGITLPEIVIGQLATQNRTLSVVDLGNCSLIADWLHDVDPSGAVYRGTLGVATDGSPDELKTVARQTFGSDLVMMLGPAFEHSGMLKRDVHIDSADNGIRSRFDVSVNSSIVIPRSIKQALNFLRLSLAREKI